MIKFFARFIILIIAAAIIFGSSVGLEVNSFLVAGIFICAWLTIIAFEDILWWIIIFSLFFSFIYYDNLGLYMMGLIGIAYFFDFIYINFKKMGRNNMLIIYLVSFGMIFVIEVLIEVIYLHAIFFDLKAFFANIIIIMILFFIFRFFIKYIEKFINLYTHGTDMRCHT